MVHYDETLPLVLSCDASSYGAGAVFSHVINGKHQPIAFAYFNRNAKELFTTGERSFYHHIWVETISSVSVWSFVYYINRSSTSFIQLPACKDGLLSWLHTITRLNIEAPLHMLMLPLCPS